MSASETDYLTHDHYFLSRSHDDSARRTLWVVGLTAVMMVGEIIAGLVYERDSITSQATAIGQLETVGLSWKLMDTELADLESVTPQDIQNAAKKYFTRERLSVAHVLPMETTHE